MPCLNFNLFLAAVLCVVVLSFIRVLASLK